MDRYLAPELALVEGLVRDRVILEAAGISGWDRSYDRSPLGRARNRDVCRLT